MNFNKSYFSISKDERINYATYGVIFLTDIKSKDDIPSMIKFGDLSKATLNISDEGNFMTPEQYPEKCDTICFGKKKPSDKLDFLKKNDLVVNNARTLNFSEGATGIKNIRWTTDYDDCAIYCAHSTFKLKDLGNIHLNNKSGSSFICTLNLNGSVAGKEFSSEIEKIEQTEKDIFRRTNSWGEYIRKTFPFIEGLSTIRFTRFNVRDFDNYEFKNVDTKKPMLYKM